jgi:hypothetical protein
MRGVSGKLISAGTTRKRIGLTRVTRIFQDSLSSKFALEGRRAVAAVRHDVDTQELQAKATLHALRGPEVEVSRYLSLLSVLLINRNLQGGVPDNAFCYLGS